VSTEPRAASAPGQDYDIVVVGAGQGGIPFAKAAAGRGRKVALIERRFVAGTCINEGCTPTKTMIASAYTAERARRAGEYGVEVGAVQVDMAAVRRRTQDIVLEWRRGSEKRLRDTEGLDLVYGEASFSSPGRMSVELRHGGSLQITAPVFVLDTGGRPSVPPLAGLDGVPFLDTNTVLELREVPAKLVILGGGYVAVEYAQMMRRFGSEVTVVQRGPRLLSREDEDVSEAVAEILREDGVELLLDTQATSVAGEPGSLALEVETAEGGRRLRGTHLLVAVGRRPNVEELGLDRVGVEQDEKGHVRVDGGLRTTAEGVYAIGDVTGGPAFTHVSYDDFRILQANLLDGGEATTDGRIVPYTVYTDPQLGRVGESEQQARDRGADVQVLSLATAAVARAVETGEKRGFLKAVVERERGTILGAAMLAPEGGELAAMVQIAMLAGLPAARLRDGVFAHPTLAESLNTLFADLDEPLRPQ
jgi:pyruvate/2-oxoglutarate dehydrogenase complex dihydrolipoamide dehydrogenase (E3) component